LRCLFAINTAQFDYDLVTDLFDFLLGLHAIVAAPHQEDVFVAFRVKVIQKLSDHKFFIDLIAALIGKVHLVQKRYWNYRSDFGYHFCVFDCFEVFQKHLNSTQSCIMEGSSVQHDFQKKVQHSRIVENALSVYSVVIIGETLLRLFFCCVPKDALKHLKCHVQIPYR